MNPRVMFFFDGFNLYHSILSAERARAGRTLKWLDLAALADAHLYTFGPSAAMVGVHYFTAYTEHCALTQPERLARHRAYVRALTATGVNVHLGHFKPRDIWIERLGDYEHVWQEKATDVNIVAQVFVQAARNVFDIAVIVSGDADFAPALPVFKEMFPAKRLVFGFPYDRKNKQLARVAPDSFTFSCESYAAHQLPDAVRLPSGKYVIRPRAWPGSNPASAHSLEEPRQIERWGRMKKPPPPLPRVRAGRSTPSGSGRTRVRRRGLR